MYIKKKIIEVWEQSSVPSVKGRYTWPNEGEYTICKVNACRINPRFYGRIHFLTKFLD